MGKQREGQELDSAMPSAPKWNHASGSKECCSGDGAEGGSQIVLGGISVPLAFKVTR